MKQPLPSLSSLLGDLSLQSFLSEHWDRRPLHVKGPPERLQAALDRETLLSRIRSARKVTATAFFPDPDHAVSARTGVRPMLEIASDQVDAALASGAAITVKNVEELDDRIAPWTLALRRELGIAGRFLCRAWLAPPQATVEPHFDAGSVLSLQLSGRKTWRISRSPAMFRPAAMGMALPDGSCAYPEGSSLGGRRHEWEHHAERFDDASCDSYEVGPGDMLFVPAGFWHATAPANGEHIFSLNVFFERVNLFEWITEAFEPVLGAEPEWRHLPPQPGADGGEIPPALRAFFAERLAELSRALAAPDAVDRVLHRAFKRSLAELPSGAVNAPATTSPRHAAPVGREDVLAIRNPLQWTFMDTRDAQGRPFVEIFTGQREILFDDPGIIPFGRELGRRKRFVAGEAMHWAGEGRSYPWEQVQQMLAALVEDGAIVIESRGALDRHLGG